MFKKPFPNYSALLVLIFSLQIILASCSGAKDPLAVTEQPVIESPTAKISPTSMPSRTPMPTPTISFTSTVTLEPTTTSSPTPPPPPDDFSKVKLLSYGPLPNWDFSFTFQFPSAVKGVYYVETIDPKKVYPCRPLLEYNHPDRLFCLGRVPAMEKIVGYNLKDAATDAILFSGKIGIQFQ
jgi:hypothetical protein